MNMLRVVWSRIKKLNPRDVIIGLMILVFIFGLFKGTGLRKELKELKKERKELQRQVDSVNRDNQTLQISIERFRQEIIKYDKMLVESNRKLEKIQWKYEEILKSIDNYTISDLQRFFSNRYRRFESN